MPALPFFVFFLSLVSSLPGSLQTALLAPVHKDNSTGQYTVQVYLKTPPQPSRLLLDLGASFSWLDCYQNYSSSTYRHIPCNASLCTSLHSLACSNCDQAPGPACGNYTCALFPENPVTRQAAIANAIVDSLALPTTDGSTQGLLGLVPDFVFSCSPTFLLQGLANGVTGLAALGRSNYSLPAQVSAALPSPLYFALCLTGTPLDPGVLFLGTSGPYYFNSSTSRIDLSKLLIYTPLILNPVGSTLVTYNRQPSDEYFIGLTSVNVNGKAVQLNRSLLTIDENGSGGTKISTVHPYTLLETSIYKAFTELFTTEASGLNLTVTKAVQPFSVCYPATDVSSTRVGPAVPTVDLVMQSDDVFWRIFGSNSMVRIERSDADVWCLGFVDGGVEAKTSVVIGGHQLEDNLLQFDLESKRLGFSSSVLARGTSCANFDLSPNQNP